MDDLDPLDVRLARDAGWLRRLAGALVDDVDDLAQDAAVARLTRRAARVAHPAALLRNIGRKGRRKEGRLKARERHAAMARKDLEAEATDRIVERSETASILLDEMRALTGAHRAVLVLRYFEGNSVQDIARSSGVSPAAVRQRLVRARAALRTRLEDRFGPQGPAEWYGALLLFCAPRGRGASALASSGAVLPGVFAMKSALFLCVLALAAAIAWHLGSPSASSDDVARYPVQGSDAAATVAAPEDLPAPPVNRRGRIEGAGPTPLPGQFAYPLIKQRIATVRGRVLRQPSSGAPVPVEGAELRPFIRPFGERWPRTTLEIPVSTVTGEDGRFALPYNLFEDGTIELRAEGLTTLYLRLGSENPANAPFLGEDIDTDLGDIVMAPGHRIEGTVVDGSGAPLGGAEVRRVRTPGGLLIPGWDDVFLQYRPADGITDADGRFSVLGLGSRRETLRVSCPGFHDRTVAPVEGPLVVELHPSAWIRGRITGPHAGTPRPMGVHAWVDSDLHDLMDGQGFHGAVQRDGTFEIDGLTAGREYVVQAMSDAVPSMACEPLSHRIAARGGDEDVDVETVLGASISVNFVGPTGQAPPLLELMAGFDHMTMHQQPLFRSPLLTSGFTGGVLHLERIVPNAPRQTLHLEVSARGYETWIADVGPFVPGETLSLGTIRMVPEVEGVPFRASIALVVVDGNGNPLPGASVERTFYQLRGAQAVYGGTTERRSLVTDSAGRGNMNDLRVGEYHFRYSIEEGVHLPDADALMLHRLDPALAPGAVLRVTDPPTHGDEVRLVAPPMGPLDLRLTHGGAGTVGGRLALVAGANSAFLQRLCAGRAATVRFEPRELGPDGTASFEALPFGQWTAVHVDDDRTWRCATFEHRPGHGSLVLELGSNRVTGRLVTEGGRPLADALVRFENAAIRLPLAEYWLSRRTAWRAKHGGRGLAELAAGNEASTVTDGNGRFSLEVPMLGTPSDWRLFASHGEHASREVEWHKDGENGEQALGDLALAPAGTVLLAREAVDGVAEWTLEAAQVSGDPNWACALWEDTSPPRFERVPVGQLRLVGRGPDGAVVRSTPVRVRAGETSRVEVE